MEKPAIKIAKLTLESDGNIIGDCFVIRPEPALEQQLGTLFGIVEIYNTNDGFTDSFLEAISDLKTEYFLPPFNQNKSAEKRFEEALARTNRRLHTAFNQSIEEVDLRTVSAIVGVACDNQLFFSSVGRVKGLFARNKKSGDLMLLDVLASSQEGKFRPEPEKIFANILTGELTEKDAMIFINEEFLSIFSQHEIGEAILADEPDETVKLLDDTIKQKVGKKNFYAITLRLPLPPQPEEPVIIVTKKESPVAATTHNQTTNYRSLDRHTSQATIDTATQKITAPIKKSLPPQQSIDRLIYTQVKTEKYLAPSMMPNWQKVAILAGKWLAQGVSFIAKKTQLASLATIAIIKSKYQQKFPQKNKSIFAPVQPAAKIAETLPVRHLAPQVRPTDTVDSFEAETEPEEEEYYEVTETSDTLETKTDDYFDDTEIEAGTETEAEVEAWGQETPQDTFAEPIYEAPTIAEIEMVQTFEPQIALTLGKFQLFRPGKWPEHLNYWINRKIAEFYGLKKLQRLVITAIIILVFLFCESVVVIGRASDNDNLKTTYGKISTQILDALNSAEARNIFNDETGAVESLKSAEELFSTIPNKGATKALKAELDIKIKQSAEKLQKISYQTPIVVIDFKQTTPAADVSGLAKVGTALWLFDNSTNLLKRFDTANNKVEDKTSTLSAIKKMAVGITDNNVLVLATNADSYYRYDISQGTAEKFKPTKNYFQLKSLPPNSPLVDPALGSSTPVMSATIETYSFVLDSTNSRLVIFDKANILKRQYISDKLKTATSVVADVANKKIWFVADNKIFSLNVDF